MTTKVSTNRSSMIPTGVHRFVVVDVEERMGGSGYPYWNFTLEVAEGADWDGQTLWHMVSLSPNARWRMDNWLDAFGIPPGKEVGGEDFIGKTFRGQVEHDVYEGKTRPKISQELPDGKAEKPASGAGKRAVVIQKAEEPEPEEEPEPGETTPDAAGDTQNSAAEDGSDVKTDKGLPEIKTTSGRGRKRKVF